VRRLMLLPALALAAFGAMGTAASAAVPVRQSAVVLNVLVEKHTLRLVEGPRVVDLHYHAPITAGVSAGARITFEPAGTRATHILLTGRADRVSVPGFVVRAGKLLALRLADGSTLALPKTSRLAVGTLAHVVVRFLAGGATTTPVPGTTTTPGTPKPNPPPTTTAPTTPTAHCAKADCTFDTIASVSAIDATGNLTLIPVSGGATIVTSPGNVPTDDVYVGDFVHVTGTQSSTSGAYTLSSLDELVGCDNVSCVLTLDATVDEIDATSVIVEDSTGDEYQIDATAQQLAALTVGESVHVVGTQDPTTGNYTATTIKKS
jgi:hypothetical protein